jgi:hypothetical protein
VLAGHGERLDVAGTVEQLVFQCEVAEQRLVERLRLFSDSSLRTASVRACATRVSAIWISVWVRSSMVRSRVSVSGADIRISPLKLVYDDCAWSTYAFGYPVGMPELTPKQL